MGKENRLYRLRHVLPISNHVTTLSGSFSILLYAFMSQLFLARNMVKNSKDVLTID